MAHQNPLSRVWEWLVRHWRDLLQFGWPFALFETFNFFFDKGFFPLSIWAWGPVWGAVVPVVFALGINAFIFWLYEHMKVDWLKAHALRELADKENKTNLEKVLTWHLTPRTTLWERAVGEIRFALLLVAVDPVIVAIYYRDNHFEGLDRGDWWLLVKATIVACIVWLLIVEPLTLAAQLVWHLFF